MDELYTTFREPKKPFKQDQMLVSKAKVVGLIGLLSVVVGIGIYIITSDLSSARHQPESDRLARLLRQQKALVALDADRRATIQKIKGIISRFNSDMEGGMKEEIAGEVYLMSRKYPNLDVDFICATITHESAKSWDPKVTSRVGAMGLMQIMPTTGAFLAVQEGINWSTPGQVLYDPIVNIRLGCRYLSELVGMYEHDGGLAAYNAGPKRAAIWLASNRNTNKLPSETREYYPAVLKLYDQFRAEGVM